MRSLGTLLLLGVGVACGCQGCHKRAVESPAPAARRPLSPIPRFDVHTHIHPDDLPEAMRLYARQNIVGVLNLSGGNGPTLVAQLQAAQPYGGRVLDSVTLSGRGMLLPGWVERQVEFLREAKKAGVRGLKFHKALGLGWADPDGARVKIDDPRLDPIFEEAGRLGLIVSIHSGDPKAFFKPPTPDNERYDELQANPGWSFSGPQYPSWEELFAEFEHRVARHPDTTFIGVHFGNDPEDPAHVSQLLRTYPNLYVDTAARIGEIGRQKPEVLRAIFVEHRKRILFGTDFSLAEGEMMLGAPDGSTPTVADFDRFFAATWRFFETGDQKIAHPTPIQGRWTVDAIDLPREVLEDVYHRNAERLLGLPPLNLPQDAGQP
jgi:predicted TIM-barrel fold metal-dependent hydrolase